MSRIFFDLAQIWLPGEEAWSATDQVQSAISEAPEPECPEPEPSESESPEP